MIKTVLIAGTAYTLFTAATFAPANASEPTVLYDNAGNAVVAYLTCATAASPVVLYTSAHKPVAAYRSCANASNDVVIVQDKGPVEQIVTGNNSQARRTARRVVRRNND